MTRKTIDVGIIAGDAPRLASFYVDVVGVEYVEEFDSPIGSVWRLRYGDSFLKVVQAPASDGRGGLQGLDEPGLRYITMEVPDIATTWSRAIAAGAVSVRPLTEVRGGALSFGIIRDPEGNLVELVQRR